MTCNFLLNMFMYVFCIVLIRNYISISVATKSDDYQRSRFFYLSAIITILHVDGLIILDDCRFNGNTSPYELSAWLGSRAIKNWLCLLCIHIIHICDY